MAEENYKSKYEKFKSFETWPQWANLTQTILEKKEV